MTEAIVLERRREALKTAAHLQRRNVTIRWRTLRSKRAVQVVESGLAATRTLRDSTGAVMPYVASRSRGWLWLANALRIVTRSRSGFFGTALRLLRRPSLWSVAMLVGRWWLRRRRRRHRHDTLRTRAGDRHVVIRRANEYRRA